MTNTAGQPTLVFPSIDPAWCPSGTWAEIFADWQEKYGRAVSVVIPGFGSIDLTQLAQLVQTVEQQQAEINALTKAKRAGFGAPVVLNDVTTVTFAEMPSTNYKVRLTLVDAGSPVPAGDFGLTLVPASRQVTQFQFRSNNVPATFTVDWDIEEV